MDKLIDKIFDINKIPTKLIFIIGLSCGFILFGSEQILTKLNILEIRKEYGKYIGLAFIISSVFLIVTFITFISNLIAKRKDKNSIKRGILKSIQCLNLHEKALLREFIINNKSTLQLPLDDETVVGLVNKNILYKASGNGFTYPHGAYFTYSITEFAKENINFELIDLPDNPSEKDILKISQDRPSWAREKSRFENMFNRSQI